MIHDAWRALLMVGILGVASAVTAQPARKVPRVGVLLQGSAAASSASASADAFRQGLRERGWVEGQTIAVEWRFAEGQLDRMPALARELVALAVDVFVTNTNAGVRSLTAATGTIPVVVVAGSDGRWLAQMTNIARPGGNLTGLSSISTELEPKRLELLKESVPGISRVAALRDTRVSSTAPEAEQVVSRTQRWGLTFIGIPVRGPEDFDGAFATAAAERAQAITVLPTPLVYTHRRRLAELAIRHRLAWVAPDREYAEAGSLMSYGADPIDLIRRSAGYVDKILRGAKPGDLPIEEPMRFELVVNQSTAKALGLTIPEIVLFRADRVIR